MREPSESSDLPGNPAIALIILAAGASTRLGQPKQLLQFRGRSLLRDAAETALGSVCRPVVVVLGASAEQFQTELAALPVTVVVNSAWPEGMGSSIRTGMKTVVSGPAVPDAVVIMLCDQPLVTSAMLDKLVQVHRSEARGIVASAYEGTAGVPALFSRKYYPALALLRGDQGARRIIVKYENDLARVSTPEAAFDVDQLEDAALLGTPITGTLR